MHKDLKAAMKAQIEARAELNKLADDATAEARSAAVTALETADQAVADALDHDDTPATAPGELRDRISLTRYLAFVAEERAADGAEQELRTELGLSDQAIPLEALLPTAEERADQVSPQTSDTSKNDQLASGAVNETTGPLLGRVFKATDAAFLNVAMPTVPAGKRRYPVMTGGTTAAMVARGAQQDAGPARFDVEDVSPTRLSGRYVFDLEGVAELGTMLEGTLRSDLRTVMGLQIDNQILNGNGTAPNISGIIAEIPLTLPPGQTFATNDPSKVPAWADDRTMVYMSLDGEYSRTEADIRLLIGGDTYNLFRNSFRNNNAADAADAIDAIRQLGAPIRRSFQIPDPAVATISPKSAASAKKVQRAIINSEPGGAVAPVWQGITMIRDPYTNAGKGQIVLTANMLFGFVFRRKAGWKQYAIRTEA